MASPSAVTEHVAPKPAKASCEVLVIGAGPSGASAAYWLAEAGHDVILIEKKHFPREKTCGDGLTPRAVRQLLDMDLADDLSSHHRFDGLRCLAFGKELLLDWPRHPDYPSYGYVITRAELDAIVAARAEKAGATLWQGVEAIAPLGEHASSGGGMKGALVKNHDDNHTTEVHASYVVVADGANSRIGRALGATRKRSVPLGLALRGYYTSPRSEEPYIESHLDIRDRDGTVVPGYGWVFPLGDGRVNVGIGLLCTEGHWRNVNTTKLMETFVDYAPASWCLSDESACGAPTGGKLPMGLSVGPRVGTDYLLVGDAGGSINPFNGEGIAYGYETGRLAATTISEAIAVGDTRALLHYENGLQDAYGLYFKIASAFMRLMGRPDAMRRVVGTGMYSRTLMEWIMRIMTNMLREDEKGPAELAYRAVAKVARAFP
jgi:geranylgeranyl reductase family protein